MGVYRTFTKSEKFRVSITIIYLAIFLLFFLSIPMLFQWVGLLFIGMLVFFFILGAWIIKFFTFSTPAKFHGEFDGTLEFCQDKVVIRDAEYPINSIRKIELEVSDYAGKGSFVVTLDPNLSNGTDNNLVLTLKTQEKVRVYFQLQSKVHFRQEREALISYHKHHKISFLRLIDLLGIKKYEAIQEFKKSL